MADDDSVRSTRSSKASSSPKPANGVKRRRSAGMGTQRLQRESVETRRIAALVLEVLAGVRTPSEAAEVLGISPPRYYMLEARALKGLVVACRRRPRGPTRSPEREIARLQRELKRLERECDRYQALLRLAERTIGVPARTASPSKSPKSAEKTSSTKAKRKRRPVARALRAARALEAAEEICVDESAGRGDHAADVKS
jgi:hypothetical protein